MGSVVSVYLSVRQSLSTMKTSPTPVLTLLLILAFSCQGLRVRTKCSSGASCVHTQSGRGSVQLKQQCSGATCGISYGETQNGGRVTSQGNQQNKPYGQNKQNGRRVNPAGGGVRGGLGGATRGNTGTVDGTYTQTEQKYSSNNLGYNSNGQEYNSNNQGYISNNQRYNSNYQGYNSNNQGYTSNNQRYNSNGQGYNSKNQGYNLNSQEYTSNNQEYNLNGQEYNSNNQRYNSNSQGYNSDQQKGSGLRITSRCTSGASCVHTQNGEGSVQLDQNCNGATCGVNYGKTIVPNQGNPSNIQNTYQQDFRGPNSGIVGGRAKEIYCRIGIQHHVCSDEGFCQVTCNSGNKKSVSGCLQPTLSGDGNKLQCL